MQETKVISKLNPEKSWQEIEVFILIERIPAENVWVVFSLTTLRQESNYCK